MLNSAARDLITEAVSTALTDPDWFCKHILNSENDPWQSEIINAVADLDRQRLGVATVCNHELLNRVSIRSCHGPGKTHVLAKLMHWWNFTRRGTIPCTAPKERQLVTRLWPEFRRLRASAVPGYRKLVSATTLKVEWCNDPDWCALVETASSPENLAGYHDDWLLFLVDEANGVSDQMFPAIEGALTTEGAVLVMIGNPTKTSGEFYRSHCKLGTRELYYKRHVRPEDSPRVSPKWVEQMRRKYGVHSPIYKVRVMGDFAEGFEEILITMTWIDDAVAKWDTRPERASNPKTRISVDVADGGEDDTVVTVGRHYSEDLVIEEQREHNFEASKSPIKAAEAAIETWERYGCNEANGDDMVIDSMGVGAGTAGYLIKLGYPVITYKGGEASDEPSEWRNRRVQSYLACRNDFRDGHIYINPAILDEAYDDFMGQVTSVQKRQSGTERVEDIMTKREMKAQGLKSPDRADSLVMQYATSLPLLGGREADNYEIASVGVMESADDAW